MSYYRPAPSQVFTGLRAKTVKIVKTVVCAALLAHTLLARTLPVAAQVNVTVNASSPRAAAPLEGLGIGTAVYSNQFGFSQLDDRLNEAGVTTLRYSGGGYADVYHWSVHQDSPFGGSTDKGYVALQTTFPGLLNIMNNMGNGQAVITVNYGSALKLSESTTVVPNFGGQPQEAAAWVAYANADASIYGTPNDIVLGVDQQGNDWKTAGYWAKLRASTQSQYQSWATTDGVYNPLNNFLAINRPDPAGIKYWEIGNETFGTGYHGGGNGFSTDYHVPYDGTNRNGHPDLSPAHYGAKVVEYSQLMKTVDPTIKIGAVLGTPPDDYGAWAGSGPSGWNEQVLSQSAVNINIPGAGSLPATDFVIVHWYPSISNNSNGNALLAFPRQKIDLMINGTTPGLDTGANAGIKDTLAAKGIPNAEIMVTEFNYFGSVQSSLRNAANALFVADSYATWLENGVKSVQYLEMSKPEFLSDNSSLTRGAAFYAIQMLNHMFDPGDEFVAAGSSSNNVRAHAAVQDDGTVAVLLLNMSTSSQNVNVTISGADLTLDGTLFSSEGTGITSTAVSNLGEAFSTSIPGRTLYLYLLEAEAGMPGDLNDDSLVDDQDIDILWHVVRYGTNDPNNNDDEDLNGDSLVNEDDVDYMLAGLLDAGPNRAYGDADLDGGVGGLDFTAWRLRAGTGWANGDFDGDGGIGGLDFTLWRTRPTAYPDEIGPHSGIAAVPEPGGVILLLLALPMLALTRLRQSGRDQETILVCR